MTARRKGSAWLAAALLAGAAGGCATPSREASNRTTAPIVRLAIDGAANGNASIAARGRDVVVVWAATAESATNLYASVSHDSGATFGRPIRVNDVDGDARVSGEQAPRVAIAGEIVVVWTSRAAGRSRIRLARSTDAGHSFLPAVTIHDLGLDGARGWASVALDEAGAAHVVWLDGRDSPPHASAAPGAQQSHAMHGTMRQDVFETTWSPQGQATEVRLATNVCFCCKTSVSVGTEGQIVAAWRANYPTNIRDMAAAVSVDGGKTFSAPTRVSEDHWQLDACPEDGPATAIGPNDVIHIVWPSVIGDAAQTRKAIFYSTSTDGGRSFVPRVRVDEAAGGAAHPQIVHGAAGVAAVWDEHAEGGRVVRLRSLTGADGRTASTSPVIALSDHGSAVYPSIAAVENAWIVAWTETDSTGTAIRVRRWN